MRNAKLLTEIYKERLYKSIDFGYHIKGGLDVRL